MPETENESKPGVDFSQWLSGVKRRRWWFLFAFCGTALATIGMLSFVPNRYRSEATLLVVQQQVPQRYVVPTSTGEISDELQAMTQEVLSRTRLLGIIDEFGLYSKEKKRLAPEEIIELMRRNIEIEPVKIRPGEKQFNAFKISFIGENPGIAQAVASRLTSLFIEENLKTRADQATNTTDFLREQLEAAKTKLAEQEERMREFKMHNLGELPEQQSGNLAILAGLQEQLQNVAATLSRAREQRVYLESLLSGYRTLNAHSASVPSSTQVPTQAEILQADITRLQSEKQSLLAVYTSEHPSVVKVNVEIAEKQAELARIKSSKTDAAQPATDAAAQTGDDTAMAQIKSQLQANELEIKNLSNDEQRLKAATEEYQNRLNATPVREQQLAGIVRDYELMKQDYADLVSKQEQSQLATSLEKHQEGQQFRLIDPPNLPVVPSSPPRLQISIGGVVAGLFFGIALAVFIDGRERLFYSEKQIRERINVPLVVALPILRTRREQHRRIWGKTFEWFAGSVLVLMVVAAEFYINRHG